MWMCGSGRSAAALSQYCPEFSHSKQKSDQFLGVNAILHVRQWADVLSIKRQKRPFQNVINRLKLLCSNNYCIIFKGLVARSHSLLVFLFYIHSYTTHSLITFVEFHSSFLIDVRLGRGPHWNAEPKFELRAALQQPDAQLTEPRRTLNWATPHPNWATPHPDWATPHPNWSTVRPWQSFSFKTRSFLFLWGFKNHFNHINLNIRNHVGGHGDGLRGGWGNGHGVGN